MAERGGFYCYSFDSFHICLNINILHNIHPIYKID